MTLSHNNSGEKMRSGREDFLCRLLDIGGKDLCDNSTAFEKKRFCSSD